MTLRAGFKQLNPEEPRTVESSRYGHHWLTHIHPASFAAPVLTAELADKWVEMSREVPGSSSMVRDAIVGFCRHLEGQLDVRSRSDFQLVDLRVRHLDSWEMSLLEQQRLKLSDTPYRKAVHLFALLRRIVSDNDRALNQKIVDRLSRPTRLIHIRNAPRPDFPDEELRRIRSAAHRLVFQTKLKLKQDPKVNVSEDVLVALHVLLSMATGEPPEVLRQLSYSDVIATAIPGYNAARNESLGRLAELDIIATLSITYTKSRSGLRYDEIYNRELHRAAHQAIRDTVTITARARALSSNNSLWLTQSKGEPHELNWTKISLRKWCDRYVLGARIEGKAQFGRLRKSTIRRELIASPARYLRDGRRHTTQTMLAHYTNSTVLRAHVGKLLVDSIQGFFDGAVGPTVVTPEAEELLRQSAVASSDSIDSDAPFAMPVAHKGALTDCVDPLDSPHGHRGSLCPVSLAGQCFTCPNAVITQEHLPAMLEMNRISAPESSTDAKIWQEVWEPIYKSTSTILKLFPAQKVHEAKTLGGTVLVDLGIRNGPRGLGN